MKKKQTNNNGLGKILIKDLNKKHMKVFSEKIKFPKQSDKHYQINKLSSKINQPQIQQYLNLKNLQNQQYNSLYVKQKQLKQQLKSKQIKNSPIIYLPQNNRLLKNRIPIKPIWNKQITKQEYLLCTKYSLEENKVFLQWRKQLAQFQQNHLHLKISPYQKNIEVWKQFWRVFQKSDLIIQIIDGRNPLFFICQDLRKNALKQKKQYLLVVNKCDLLSNQILDQWSKYFNQHKYKFVFFSIKQKNQNQKIIQNELQLISIFSQLLKKPQMKYIGIFGYPNVGKSSIINKIMGNKRVAVSQLPGKTKHMQTIPLSSQFTLLDCPGLVFPNIAYSYQQFVLNGIVPLDNLVNYMSSIEIIVNRIPKDIFYQIYGLKLEKINAEQLLQTYARKKGYYKGNGNQNISVAARHILKAYVKGQILYMQKPLNNNQQLWQFNSMQKIIKNKIQNKSQNIQPISKKNINSIEENMNKDFFIKKIQWNNIQIEELLQGKQVNGIKLNKEARRQLKFALKRGQNIQTLLKNYLKSLQKKQYYIC